MTLLILNNQLKHPLVYLVIIIKNLKNLHEIKVDWSSGVIVRGFTSLK